MFYHLFLYIIYYNKNYKRHYKNTQNTIDKRSAVWYTLINLINTTKHYKNNTDM